MKISIYVSLLLGFPGGSEVKNLPANAGDMGSIPGSGRSPGVGNGNSWSRKWQPTPEFLPRESHGQEPGGLQSMGSQRVGHDLVTE